MVLVGLRHFASDIAVPPRVPKMVEPDAFEVGADLAITPGSVVLRTPVFELIQYRPATATVRQIPLLIILPTINKFYVIDLAPGRSLAAEYLIGQGLQVFMVSWRSPDARHAKWGFDTYGQAILDAMDAVGRITRTERTALMGCCSGGILSSMVAAHLAHTGRQDQIAALSLMVTVLDQARAAARGELPRLLVAGLRELAGRALRRGGGRSRGAGRRRGWSRSATRPGRTSMTVDTPRHGPAGATGTGALMVPGHPRVLLKMITPRRSIPAATSSLPTWRPSTPSRAPRPCRR
jgi:Poly-beta-hydroxybutyrate polymerase (PhaC) N-terminus